MDQFETLQPICSLTHIFLILNDSCIKEMADLQADVLIVGAGLAGLAAAKTLTRQNVDFLLAEASDSCGGRVKTEHYKGYTLDHGFQVMLTAYPECQDFLDYQKLNLRFFQPGSVIRINGKFSKIVDPANQPLEAFESIFSPVGTFSDKIKLLSLRAKIKNRSLVDIFNESEEHPTIDHLKEHGFSDKIIKHLFKPFLGGIYLDRELKTSDKFLYFVFKMFSEGDTAIPSGGMQDIPKQMQASLDPEKILLNHNLESFDNKIATFSNGSRIIFNKLILAADASLASKLGYLNSKVEYNSTTNVYFELDKDEVPVKEPMLVLNGGDGIINNLSFLTNIAPEYAPEGKALLSASLVGNFSSNEAVDIIRKELVNWWGEDTRNWNFLKSFVIPNALPRQEVGEMFRTNDGEEVLLAGDYLESASINGALASGRKAAEKAIATI